MESDIDYQRWEFIKENKKVRKKRKKHAFDKENDQEKKERKHASTKKTIKKRESFSFFLDRFLGR